MQAIREIVLNTLSHKQWRCYNRCRVILVTSMVATSTGLSSSLLSKEQACSWCLVHTKATLQVSPLLLCLVSLENTFYQDLSGPQGNSEAYGDRSALWPTLEQSGPAQLSPQQPRSYPTGGGSGQMGVPVPLYSVPETHLLGTSGSMAVTGAPGGTAWEEAQQIHLPPGKSCQEGSEPWVGRCGGEQAEEGGAGASVRCGVGACEALGGGCACD